MSHNIKKYKSLYGVPTVDIGSISLFLSSNEFINKIIVYDNSKT